jgi:hypothetical protein
VVIGFLIAFVSSAAEQLPVLLARRLRAQATEVEGTCKGYCTFQIPMRNNDIGLYFFKENIKLY